MCSTCYVPLGGVENVSVLAAVVVDPTLFACLPRHRGADRNEEVVERVRDDHVVVDTHESRDDNHSVSDAYIKKDIYYPAH